MPQILFHEPFHPDALVLNRNGEWRFHGTPFQNEKIAQLFSRSIRYDDEKEEYYLSIGRFTSPFTFEDTPLFVVGISLINGELQLELSNGHLERLGDHELEIGEDESLYCPIRGATGLKVGERARFTRPAYLALFDLGSLSESSSGSYMLSIDSLAIRLKPINAKTNG